MTEATNRVRYDIPYVPSSDEKVQTMIELAGIRSGDKAVDLGSGDGKLILALAAKGADATGLEIDDERSSLSADRIRTAGLQNKARIVKGSFWRHDLSPYDLIVLYGVPSIMERLQLKITNEAKRTVRIVSNHFEFPGWRPQEVRNSVLLYRPFS